MKPSVFLLFLLLGSGPALSAQTRGAAIGEGTRVRVSAPSVARERLVGPLVRLRTDSLFITTREDSTVGVDLASVESIEVSGGRWRIVSTVVGIYAGVFSTYLIPGACNNQGCEPGVAVPLAVLGGWLGQRHAPERWIRRSLPARSDASLP